ncbi:MAG: 16S rRNA (adenine(1518)-N(6)/adenine(1519)-N(6))-dimethyltransferase RsmA [Lachnospirales bacterium]
MIERIATHKRTKEIIAENEFLFKKRFGQNFLVDSHVVNKIVKGSEITKDDFVIEIGCGIGSLTQELLENAGKVTAIEIDKNLIPIVKKTLESYDNFEVINDDVLKVDLQKIIDESGYKRAKIVANLPYYITTPIVMGLLEQNLDIDSITVMIQKEVGDRMSAKEGTKAYGSLSVVVQYFCDVYLVANVPVNCFMPRPTVDSAVVRLKKYNDKPIEVDDEKSFFAFVKIAFSQRRKTLVNCIFNSTKYDLTKVEIENILENIGYNKSIRGEKLTVEDFSKIYKSIDKYKKV